MYLTKEEEKALDGEYGWAVEVAMKILVKLGDLFKADRLIPIHSAHVSGVSYKTLGDAATGFLEELAASGVKVKAPTTLNPMAFDLERPQLMRLTKRRIEAQKRILRIYESLGVKQTLSCTPYYISKPPRSVHLAWAESSAVVYANSVLGSWTNREGGPSALASAIVGATPNYGMHRPGEREGKVVVTVEKDLRSEEEFGVLGIHLGRILGGEIPVVRGLKSPKETCLKQFGAALASSGMVSRFILSDESTSLPQEKISVGENDLKNSLNGISSEVERPDLIFVGCPHCSYEEIKEIASLLYGKKVREDTRLWICTSRHVKSKAKEYVEIIEHAGGRVLCDTCIIVSWIEDIGIDTLLTNSAKTAYYAPNMNRVEVSLASLRKCIERACKD
ncbi:aconitase X catalytic domain-containing protein [Candidatus Bathyarchaeota archaeon]|nr:aconitase X catalytic domain-containing protein [Candidatus Bathyarchaeota archaeon]